MFSRNTLQNRQKNFQRADYIVSQQNSSKSLTFCSVRVTGTSVCKRGMSCSCTHTNMGMCAGLGDDLVEHTDVLWLAQWQHLYEPGRGADKAPRLLSPSYAPSDLLLISLERAGAGSAFAGGTSDPSSRSGNVMGQVEASQRGWIQPTGYELDNAELVTTTWTQLPWGIQLYTSIKYHLVHATVM